MMTTQTRNPKTVVPARELRIGDVIDFCHGFRRTITEIRPADASGEMRLYFAENWDRTTPATYLPSERVVVLKRAEPTPSIIVKPGHRVRHINGLPVVGTVDRVVAYGYAGGEYVSPHALVRWDSGQPGWYPFSQIFRVDQ